MNDDIDGASRDVVTSFVHILAAAPASGTPFGYRDGAADKVRGHGLSFTSISLPFVFNFILSTSSVSNGTLD